MTIPLSRPAGALRPPWCLQRHRTSLKILYGIVLGLLGMTAAGAQQGKPVKVQELSELLAPVVHDAPAEVVSANRSRISARIETGIDSIAVKTGDTVSKGQTLVVLDCSDYDLARQRAEAELQRAEAALRRARRQLERSESLARNSLLSEQQFEQRQTDSEAAAADVRRARVVLEQARLTMSRCRIESPFDGAVTERIASRGEFVRPGTPLLEVVDLQSLEVRAEVFPAEQTELANSPALFFRFLGEDYPVRIERFTPAVDPVSRTVEGHLGFKAQPAPVGASGRLIWHAGVPGLPARLLVQRDGRLGIFIARDRKAVFHALPGAEEGRPAAVDLPPDTLVVTEGRQGLRQGDTLAITP